MQKPTPKASSSKKIESEGETSDDVSSTTYLFLNYSLTRFQEPSTPVRKPTKRGRVNSNDLSNEEPKPRKKVRRIIESDDEEI